MGRDHKMNDEEPTSGPAEEAHAAIMGDRKRLGIAVADLEAHRHRNLSGTKATANRGKQELNAALHQRAKEAIEQDREKAASVVANVRSGVRVCGGAGGALSL